MTSLIYNEAMNKISDDEFEIPADELKKKENGILKIAKPFIIGLCSFIVSALIFMGGPAIKTTVDLQSYSDDTQMEEIADALNCDTRYITSEKGHFTRMQHNNGEPIYVCLDSEISESEKETIIRALDFMFGLVGQINDKYHYEIVDKTKFNLTLGKTKMYFTLGEKSVESQEGTAIAEAYINSQANPYSSLSDKSTFYKYTIAFDRAYVKEDFYANIVHELAHAFNHKDVYQRIDGFDGRHQGNTLMNIQIGDKIPLPTPNDFACLIMAYAPKSNDLEADIEKYQQMLAAYEDYYYTAYAKYCQDNYEAGGEFSGKYFSFYHTIDFPTKDDLSHQIDINGDTYTLKVYTETGEILGNASGKVVWKDGVAILKEVKLENGLYPGLQGKTFPNGYVQDLAIIKRGLVYILLDVKDGLTYPGHLIYRFPPIQLPSQSSTDSQVLE